MVGAEGGQYSIYFAPGKEQVYDNWHTPKAIDIEEWTVESISESSVLLSKTMELSNFQGSVLNLAVERKVSLMADADIAEKLELALPQDVDVVAYATENSITNNNDFVWTRKTGTVCIWMLDMFNPSDSAVTVVPYNQGDEKELGRIVTSDYFGDIPADRLLDDNNGTLFFKTDGDMRGNWE